MITGIVVAEMQLNNVVDHSADPLKRRWIMADRRSGQRRWACTWRNVLFLFRFSHASNFATDTHTMPTRE